MCIRDRGLAQLPGSRERGGDIALVLHEQDVGGPAVGDAYGRFLRLVRPGRTHHRPARHARGQRVLGPAVVDALLVRGGGLGPVDVIADRADADRGDVLEHRLGRGLGHGWHRALAGGQDGLGQGWVVVGIVEAGQHGLAQDIAVQPVQVGAGPGEGMAVQPGGEAQEAGTHLGGRSGDPMRVAGPGSPLGELREVVLDADLERGEPVAGHPGGVGVVVAVQHDAVGTVREQLAVHGAYVRAVRDAPGGQLGLAEGGPDAVEVAGLVGGADVPDELSALAGAGLRRTPGGGHVLGDGSVRGRPGKALRHAEVGGVELAVDGGGRRHAARREPDEIVGVPHTLRQLLPLAGGVGETVPTGATRDEQQRASVG